MNVELSRRDISTIWLALERDIRNKQWLSEIKDKTTTIAAIQLYSRELADEASLCVRMEKLFKEKDTNNDGTDCAD